MTDDIKARLRELLAKATPGPWFTLDPPWLPGGSETSILAESPDPHVARFICDFDLWALDDDEDRKSECPDDDARLIVECVNALPDLLDHIETLEARIAELEGENARLHALANANNDLARHEGSGRKSAMREITTLRDALAGLMPNNLGVIPTSMADSDILPLDVSIGELRRARAALNQEAGRDG